MSSSPNKSMTYSVTKWPRHLFNMVVSNIIITIITLLSFTFRVFFFILLSHHVRYTLNKFEYYNHTKY